MLKFNKDSDFYKVTIELLKELRDNFGNHKEIAAISEMYNPKLIKYHGVCSIAKFDLELSDHLGKTFVRAYGVSSAHGNRSYWYPVGGTIEFLHTSIEDMWTNPDRLKFINHSIQILEDILKEITS